MSKSPLDRALDLFVYAPLGAVFAARDALPDLIDKGRHRVSNQVSAARVMGEMAVTQGQKEAEKAMAQASRRLAGFGLVRGTAKDRPPTGQAEPAGPEPASGPAPESGATTAPGLDDAAGAAVAPAPAPAADHLAIPGYDSLSAPQVVQRLAGLATEELDAVRAYEAATRRRKTILTRIAQLQAPQP